MGRDKPENLIRACFRLPTPVPEARCLGLLQALDQLDCRFNVWRKGYGHAWLQPANVDEAIDLSETTGATNPEHLQRLAHWLATPGQCAIQLGWLMHEEVQPVSLLQMSGREGHSPTSSTYLWFDIGERLFLPGEIAEYHPQDDLAFLAYNHLIAAIVEYTAPALGVIDYEADLDNLTHPYPYWGLYMSDEITAFWPPEDWGELADLVDERRHLPGRGDLVYIHPLQYPQSARRDSRLVTLLERNWPQEAV